jgi:hypothetical protein
MRSSGLRAEEWKHVVSIDMWHRRFGHPDLNVLKKMAQNKSVEAMDDLVQSNAQMHACDVCAKAKQPRHSYHRYQSQAAQPCHLIHSDTMGPMRLECYLGEKYVVTI